MGEAESDTNIARACQNTEERGAILREVGVGGHDDRDDDRKNAKSGGEDLRGKRVAAAGGDAGTHATREVDSLK